MTHSTSNQKSPKHSTISRSGMLLKLSRILMLVIFLVTTMHGNGSASFSPAPEQKTSASQAQKAEARSAADLTNREAGTLENKIYLKNFAPPAAPEPRPLLDRHYSVSPVYCPDGTGYCYASTSGFFKIDSFFRTYNEDRALKPGGDCIYGSGNYTNVMAPDSGGDAWAIFDLGEVFEITKFISWDLHHGNWWFEYSEDKVTWNSFASGQTSWDSEHCEANTYDHSGSPVKVRYLRYRITQVTWVGNAYRVAWFSFRSNTPSKLHPPVPWKTLLGGGCTKSGQEDPRACSTGATSTLSTFGGDPVNTNTGSYTYSVGDLTISTSAGPLTIQRSYASGAVGLNLYTPNTDTSFGYGWTHNQDIRLNLSEPGQVWFKGPSANQYLFTVNEDGTYTPYAGVTASLTFNSAANQYTLVDSGQNTYTFDGNGKVLTWVNDTGLAFTYTYTDGLLSRLAGPGGTPYIDFAYTNGLLTGITDNAGRHLTYAYSGNDLVSFTNEVGTIWTYAYDQAHHMTSVAVASKDDPTHPRTLARNLYDSQGRVACQQEGDAYPPVTQFEVTGGDTVLGSDGIYRATPKVTTCKQADGSEAVATAITYNTDGANTVKDSLDNVSTHNYNISLNALSGQTDALGYASSKELDRNYRPQTITDAAAHSTKMTWSSDGANPTSLTDALNHTTSLEYDSRNHLTLMTNPDTTQSRFVFNTPGATDPLTGAVIYNPDWDEDLQLMAINNFKPGSNAPDANQVMRYTYTSAADAPEPANLLRKLDTPDSDTCYAYDSAGRQVKVFENCVDMDPFNGAPGEDLLKQTSYDSLGRVVTTTDEDGHVTRYGYYDQDNQADEVITNYDPQKAPYQDGLWNIASVNIYDYEGRLTDTISHAFDGDLNGDGMVQPAMTLDLNQDGTPEYRLEIDPAKSGFNVISHTQYDGLGRVTETVQNAWPGKAPYYLGLYNLSSRAFYDRAGRSVASVANYNPANLAGWGTPTAVDFDGDGISDATLEVNPDFPEYNQISLNQYDKAGRVTTTTRAAWPGKASYYQPSGSSSVYNLVSANEYDAVGNVVKSIANFDPAWVDADGDGFNVSVSFDPSSAPVTVRVDPDAPDRNQVSCTTYDALNRVQFSRAACVPGQADYLSAGGNLYNIVTYNVYDDAGRPFASIRNYNDPNHDGVLEYSDQFNFITRSYYDDLGRVTYTVSNFVGDLASANVVRFDPATPDRNLVTRYYYDASGQQFATVNNYWEPAASADGVLTQAEIEAGLPDKNRVSRSYFNAQGQVTRSVQNFTGNLDSAGLPTFNPGTPDRNLIAESVYDGAGKVIATIDPAGVITRIYYDALDRQSLTVHNLVASGYADVYAMIAASTPPAFDPAHPDQNVRSQTVYDAVGRSIATVDNGGVITRNYLDALNRSSVVVKNLVGQAVETNTPPAFDPAYPDHNVRSEAVYDVAGNVSSTKDEKGTTTRFCIDSQFRTYKKVVNPTVSSPCEQYTANSTTDYDQVTRYSYNLAGNTLAETNPTGKVTEAAYDNLSRLVRQVDPLQHAASFEYDAAGNKVNLKDANQVVTHYEYDGLGRLSAVIENYRPGVNANQEINVRTEYRYDASGNLTRILNGRGYATEFTYDALDRKLTERDALDHLTIYQYDAAGNRTNLLDANGATIHYTYDKLNRPTGIDYPDPDPDVSFTYNANGTHQTMTDGTGTTTWTYDDMGRVKTIQDGSQQTVGYGYDAAGNRTSLTYPGNQTVQYAYDAVGRLSQVTGWDTQVTHYGYDIASKLVSMALPNGVQTAYAYDDAGRLTGITHVKGQDVLSQYQYTLDPIGNRTQVIEGAQLRGRQLPVVEVTVADTSGRAMAGLTVRAFDRSTDTGFSAVTDADGVARLNLANTGSYRFRVDYNGYSFYSNQYNNCFVPGCTRSSIQLPRLAGTVLTSSGTPAVGVEVAVYPDAQDVTIHGITGADGTVALIVPEGCYRLHTEKEGQQAFSPRVCTTPGKGASATVQLADAGQTTVTAVDDKGAAQANVPVYLFAGQVYTGINGLTGADGKATFALPQDDYRFAPALPGGSQPADVQITVQVQDSGGAARAGAKVYALSGSDANAYQVFTGRSDVTDANGQVTFALPNVGKYRFRVEEGSLVYYSSLSNLCDPASCTSAAITAPGAGGPVTVTVTDKLAQPVAGTMVYAFDGATYTGYSAATGQNGQAVLTLPEGNYRFRAEVNGQAIFSQAENHCATPACTAAQITLANVVTVTVSADGAGTPQANVVVYAFSGTSYAEAAYTGLSSKTDSQGRATFQLPVGTYWFGYQDGSVAKEGGQTDGCAVPGCTAQALSTFQGVAITYAYDPLQRLTKADYSDGTFFHYAYDAVGNRLSEETQNGTTSFVYDHANRIQTVNGAPYAWDNNGNLLSDGSRAYAYNAANQLTAVTGDGIAASYTYNGLGDRLTSVENGLTTHFTLDIAGQLSQVLSDGTNTYLYGSGRIAQYAAGNPAYFLGDGLGSVRQLVDGTGTVTLTKRYAPYGTELSSAGNGESNYGFTGEWTDNGTKLQYLRARYYSPETGRFVSRDSWKGDYTVPLTLNKWIYTGSNPVIRKDPTGKWYCTGHPDCSTWVNNAISRLSASGDTGQLIIQFFNKYDSDIMKGQDATINWALQMGAEKYDPCFKSRHKAGGLQIEFTDSPFPYSMANTFDEQKVQFLKSAYITGPNPTNWGVITFAHEISHYKQGAERLTIQGEMFAQYAGAQVWIDLGEVASDMPHSLNIELVSTKLGHPEKYNPFITINKDPQPFIEDIMDNHGLKSARNKMAEGSWSYNLLPLYFIGMDESWFNDLRIDWYKSITYK